MDLVRDLLPAARTLVRAVELHETAAEAGPAVRAAPALDFKARPPQPRRDVRRLEYALPVLQKAEPKICDAFHVAKHHGQTIAARVLGQRRVEERIVRNLCSRWNMKTCQTGVRATPRDGGRQHLRRRWPALAHRREVVLVPASSAGESKRAQASAPHRQLKR